MREGSNPALRGLGIAVLVAVAPALVGGALATLGTLTFFILMLAIG